MLMEAAIGEEQSKGSTPETKWNMDAASDQMSVVYATASRLLKFSGEAYAGVPAHNTGSLYYY